MFVDLVIALFVVLIDCLVEYSAGSSLVCLPFCMFVRFVYVVVYCLFSLLIGVCLDWLPRVSVCLLRWSFALFGCLDDGLVEYLVGSLLVCLFARLVVCYGCVLFSSLLV